MVATVQGAHAPLCTYGVSVGRDTLVVPPVRSIFPLCFNECFGSAHEAVLAGTGASDGQISSGGSDWAAADKADTRRKGNVFNIFRVQGAVAYDPTTPRLPTSCQ